MLTNNSIPTQYLPFSFLSFTCNLSLILSIITAIQTIMNLEVMNKRVKIITDFVINVWRE